MIRTMVHIANENDFMDLRLYIVMLTKAAPMKGDIIYLSETNKQTLIDNFLTMVELHPIDALFNYSERLFGSLYKYRNVETENDLSISQFTADVKEHTDDISFNDCITVEDRIFDNTNNTFHITLG